MKKYRVNDVNRTWFASVQYGFRILGSAKGADNSGQYVFFPPSFSCGEETFYFILISGGKHEFSPSLLVGNWLRMQQIQGPVQATCFTPFFVSGQHFFPSLEVGNTFFAPHPFFVNVKQIFHCLGVGNRFYLSFCVSWQHVFPLLCGWETWFILSFVVGNWLRMGKKNSRSGTKALSAPLIEHYLYIKVTRESNINELFLKMETSCNFLVRKKHENGACLWAGKKEPRRRRGIFETGKCLSCRKHLFYPNGGCDKESCPCASKGSSVMLLQPLTRRHAKSMG